MQPSRRQILGMTVLAALAAAPARAALAQSVGEGEAARWEREMREHVDALNASGQMAAEDRMAMAEVLDLLNLPRQPFTQADDITGKWRVRSLQVSQYGIYAYPYFGAVITPGTRYLGFNKNTGSQRRAGTLELKDGAYAFLGGYYMAGEPTGAHSSTRPHPTDEDRERDSEGVLLNLGDGHALLLFASKFFQDAVYSGELYELRR